MPCKTTFTNAIFNDYFFYKYKNMLYLNVTGVINNGVNKK